MKLNEKLNNNKNEQRQQIPAPYKGLPTVGPQTERLLSLLSQIII